MSRLKVYMCICTCFNEKEGEKNQARSNKQHKQHSTPKAFSFPIIIRKKAASGGTRTHNTLHSRQSALPLHVHYFIHVHCTCTCNEYNMFICERPSLQSAN